jgi:hypothetical protein
MMLPQPGTQRSRVGGVFDAVTVAEGLGAFVVAEHERLWIVVDYGVLVGDEAFGRGCGADVAGEPGCFRGGVDGVAGGGSGHAAALRQVVVEVDDGVGDGAGGFDVDEVVDAAAGSGGVAVGDRGEGCAQVAVLDRQGDEAAWAAGDVPGQGSSEPAGSDGAVRVRRDGLGEQIVHGGLGVRRGDECLDPVPHRVELE